MIPETIVTVAGAFFAASIFTLTAEEIKRVPLQKNAALGLYTALPIALGVVVAFAVLCGFLQGESGFDITNLGSVDIWDWMKLLIILLISVFAAVMVNYFVSTKYEKKA